MSRKVRIATCAVPRLSPEQLKAKRADAIACAAADLAEEAGRHGADIVCLPEFSMSRFDFRKNRWRPERVPGPATRKLAAVAARHRMYVIAPLMEESGQKKAYNTAVLLDRRGRIAGQYRKTHLCLPRFSEGETTLAGDELPVFPTDFGTIGISICMDIHYPELYLALALKGAEVIFWSTAAIDYTGDLIESVVNARAIDNQVYFVCSHYIQQPYLAGKQYGRSRVVDPMGRIRADTGHFPGVAMAEVELDQTYPMWYEGRMRAAYPTMRATLFKTRRPELYGELTKPVAESHWQRGKPRHPPSRLEHLHKSKP